MAYYVVNPGGGSSSGIYYLGTGTSYNLKSLFPKDYQKLTPDKFIVAVLSAPGTSGRGFGGANGFSGYAGGFTINKTYTDGILTISGVSQGVGIRWNGNGSTELDGTQPLSIKVYAVIGDIVGI